jgi:hypothetical protein
MGYAILTAKNHLAGRPEEEITVLDALEAAGVLGLAGDAALALGGAAGHESEHSSRVVQAESVLPALRTGLNMVRLAGTALSGEQPTESTAYQARSLTPVQGAWYFRLVFDIWLNSALYGEAADGRSIEKNIARYELGLPERRGGR